MHKTRTRRRWLEPATGWGLMIMVTACGAASADTSPLVLADAASRCSAMAGTSIPASAIGLPTGGATVTQAVLVAGDPVTATSAYCRLNGSIQAEAPSDLPILYQVNLPSEWNRKTVQFGGGGSNGVVIAGTGNFNAGGSARTPLSRGYVTFGGDSGHQGTSRAFYMDQKAVANFGNEAVKRTKDVADALVQAYYRTPARRNYHIGGSKGGNEALHAAQRYGSDYDGVVAYHPVVQGAASILTWFRMWEAAYRGGGWLNPAKTELLKTRVLSTCDNLDGAQDGIVSNLQACGTAFSVDSLRCAGGSDTGDTCLSDTQIATLRLGASRLDLAFAVSNGLQGLAGFPVFTGGDLGTWFAASGNGSQSGYFGSVDGTIRYSFLRSESSTTLNFDHRNHRPQVQELSGNYDSSHPDVDAFRARGGKLILIQGTTDMLVPHGSTTEYYQALSARYANTVRDFTRYYVVPGYGHGSGVFNLEWDALTALDDWVENGQAPHKPVATDRAAATKGRTRPMCEWPAWPKYNGSGDTHRAESFTCAAI